MIDGRIKFRHLQSFLAVVHHSSLKKAAAALFVSQPAVSKTIKELEEILKVSLFDRGRSGTQLTQQAEIFAAYAEAAVHALQAATDSMGPALNAVSRPAVKIGATPAMASSFLPQALMTFRKNVPNIQISLQQV
jgi:LysR family pca operon transcriptional activator